MSLWHVNDEATQTMMSEFYHRLAMGMDKRSAFVMIDHLGYEKHFPAGKLKW